VLNVAMHLMIEETDPKERQSLLDQLTGSFRTMGDRPIDVEELNAPAWWHGEEDAYEGSMAAMSSLPRRRR
jgi:hypothetical protein